MGLRPPANKVFPSEQLDAFLIPAKPTPWGAHPPDMVAIADDPEAHCMDVPPALPPQLEAGRRVTAPAAVPASGADLHCLTHCCHNIGRATGRTNTCKASVLANCLRAAGARVSSEVARLEGLSPSAPFLYNIQPMPSAPPSASSPDTDIPDFWESPRAASGPQPAPANDARHAQSVQSEISSDSMTAPHHVGLHERAHRQKHTAKVAPLAIFADVTQSAQGPVLQSAATGNKGTAARMPPDRASAATRMAVLDRWPEGSADGQSDDGSYDSITGGQTSTESGAPQGYQSMVSNPLAHNLHSGTQILMSPHPCMTPSTRANHVQPPLQLMIKMGTPKQMLMTHAPAIGRAYPAQSLAVCTGGRFSNIQLPQYQPITKQGLLTGRMVVPLRGTPLCQAASAGNFLRPYPCLGNGQPGCPVRCSWLTKP